MKCWRKWLLYPLRRYRLWRICKAIGIKPYAWQCAYALGLVDGLEYPAGRRTGKTMAVMLRLLMGIDPCEHGMQQVLNNDPDWNGRDPHRRRWYTYEYRRLYWYCVQAGVSVPQFYLPINERGRKP